MDRNIKGKYYFLASGKMGFMPECVFLENFVSCARRYSCNEDDQKKVV